MMQLGQKRSSSMIHAASNFIAPLSNQRRQEKMILPGMITQCLALEHPTCFQIMSYTQLYQKQIGHIHEVQIISRLIQPLENCSNGQVQVSTIACSEVSLEGSPSCLLGQVFFGISEVLQVFKRNLKAAGELVLISPRGCFLAEFLDVCQNVPSGKQTVRY